MTVARAPSLGEIIRAALAANSRELRVALPCEVVSYDAEKQAADLQPLIRDVIAEGEEPTSLPILPAVPVSWHGGGGFFLSFPLTEGDQGFAIFCDRSIDRWVGGDGGEVEPGWTHSHDLSDGFFIPGGKAYRRAFKEASADRAVLGKDDGGLQLTISADVLEATLRNHPAVSVAIADHLEALYGTTAGGLVSWLETHTHPTGTGPSGPPPAAPVVPAWDPLINSSRVIIPDNESTP